MKSHDAGRAFLDESRLSFAGPPRRKAPDLRSPVHTGKHVVSRPKSVRRYASTRAPLATLEECLREAGGIGEGGRRNIPSAGALYGLEIAHVPLTGGTVRELVLGVTFLDLEGSLATAEMVSAIHFGQIEGDGHLVVVSADLERYEQRYGTRGVRYALLEAGHFAQELGSRLQRRELSSVPLGAFADELAISLVGAEHREVVPLYCLAVGIAA